MNEIPLRPWWHTHAACRGVGPAIFYPTRGEDHEPALEYCQRCPVAEHCLNYALDTGDKYGIWATSERQRRTLRRTRRLDEERSA